MKKKSCCPSEDTNFHFNFEYGNSSNGSFDDSACDLSTNDYSQDTVNAFCLFLHNMYAYIVREQNPRIIM